jgi:hypothetical protein
VENPCALQGSRELLDPFDRARFDHFGVVVEALLEQRYPFEHETRLSRWG